MEDRTIGWLNQEYLEHWRTINRFKFLAKFKSEEMTDNELVNLYYHELDFIRTCIEYWQVDESREWEISEYTGRLYYRENIYGERDDGRDGVGEGDEEESSDGRSGDRSGQER